MWQKITSILCLLISLAMLCNIQFQNYNELLIDFQSPTQCNANPSSIVLTSNNSEDDNNIEDPSLYATAACLLDAASGRVLYSRDAYTPMPMASTTKVMTCILALESGLIDDVVTVSKYASTMPDVQLNIVEGEQYILRDLLYSLMLESHNDTAVAIAEHIGGSVEGFAQLMNAKAAELGCANTNFVTPNGLDADGHQTTAEELCLIAAYAINNAEFLDIISTPSYNFCDITGKRSFSVTNHDAFLTMYDGALGIKTGFTNKAGYCFVGAAKRDDITLVSSVLACGWPPNKAYKWSDTKALMNLGFENYSYKQLLSGTYSSSTESTPTQSEDGTIILLNPISIQNEEGLANSLTKSIDISFQADCTMLLSHNENVILTIDLPSSISAPIQEGEILGVAHLTVDDEVVYEYPISAKTSAEELSSKDFVHLIMDLFLL